MEDDAGDWERRGLSFYGQGDQAESGQGRRTAKYDLMQVSPHTLPVALTRSGQTIE